MFLGSQSGHGTALAQAVLLHPVQGRSPDGWCRFEKMESKKLKAGFGQRMVDRGKSRKEIKPHAVQCDSGFLAWPHR